MTTKIGGIVVDIDARLTKLEASLAKANRNFYRFDKDIRAKGQAIESSVSKIDAGFAKLGASVAGFISVAGLTTVANLGRQILEFADNLSTAADQAGLSVTRYQTLREALRTLEIDTQAADRIFKTLQTTLGDVQSGAENGATKAIERLGLTQDIASGKIKDGGQLLDALAEASKRAGTEAQFTSDIVDIFGRKVGVDLAAALRDGGAQLHALEQQMIDTGLVIDEQMIEKLADANEAIDRWTTALQQSAVIGLGTFIDWLETAGSAVDRFIREKLGPLGQIAIGVPFIGAESADIARQGAGVADAFRRQLEFNRAGASIRPPAPKTPKAGRAARTPREKKREPTPAELRDQAMWEMPGFGSLVAADELLPDIKSEVADLSRLLPTVDLGSVLTVEDQARLLRFSEDFTQDLSGGLADAIVFGEDLGDVLENTFKRAAAALLESGLMNFLSGGTQGTSFSDIFSNIGSIFGGGKGLNSGAEMGGAPLDILQGLGIPGFADGGPFGRGWAVVGEEGPELAYFDRPGTMVPNHRLMAANDALGVDGTAGGIHFTINAPGATAETVSMIRRELANAAPALIAASTRATTRQLGRRALG